MKTFSKKKLAIALALGMGLGTSGVASALVLGTAVMNLTNLKFTNDARVAFTNGSEINIVSATNASASNNATLNGVSESITGVSVAAPGTIDLPITAPNGTFTPSGNDLCVGGGCPQPNNEFATSLVSSGNGDPTVNQAFADQLLQGAAVNFPGITAGTQVATEATAQLVDDGTSSAASENGLLATYDFISLTDDDHFNIEFNASAYLEAHRSADITSPDIAASLANYQVTFTLSRLITGGSVTILDWAPNGTTGIATGLVFNTGGFSLNTSVGVDQNTGTTDFVGASLDVANTGFFRAQSTETLISGTRYRLVAAEKTSTSVTQTQIPEPATLALLGIGLLGIGASARRKQAV